MQLVIVESPTKARKLSGYLDGKEYTIEASVGHVRDLPKSGLGIDIENNFEPTYEVYENKESVVSKLQKLAKKADSVILATDPDREGEAISWHLQTILSDKAGLQPDNFKRATFHEITKKAVLQAIDHPSKLNASLVDAQQARRVVDRLVGYKVSPVLWKKIRRGLSAGRVQSVALRLIVEREREIEAFEPDEYWELDVALSTEANTPEKLFEEGSLPDELPQHILVARVQSLNGKSYKPSTEADVTGVMAVINHDKTQYQVNDVERKQRRRSSLPPFTTSTLQQTAATRLGFTSKQTMTLAQQLYEEGLITYHRTDSFALSKDAVGAARSYIAGRFGDKFVPEKPRVFSKSSKNAQEAHEAIRVTDISKQENDILKESKKFGPRHVKLYDLIWRRFIASQMEAAVYDQTAIVIAATPKAELDAFVSGEGKKIADLELRSTGSILKFAGWMELFPSGQDTVLPNVEPKQDLQYMDAFAAQKFTQPPPRYNDASLVKELEKRGIGRPSTYASIISVIEDRGYVERDQKRFIATAIGSTVCDFLVQHFETIMDYDFTAEMEEDLDRIARGEKEWRNIVGTFYKPLEKKIENVTEKAERKQIPVEKTGEKCPDCEEGEIVIRTGRFGKFKSCSRYPDCKFTENIVETVDDVKCPVCQQGDVVIKKSRWGRTFYGCGRYPKCDWADSKPPKPGFMLSEKEWAEIKAEREERKKARAEKKKKGSGSGTKKKKTSSKRTKKAKK